MMDFLWLSHYQDGYVRVGVLLFHIPLTHRLISCYIEELIVEPVSACQSLVDSYRLEIGFCEMK
uniref:Uncharacterized protein n=1 Tax=Anguilla anguilla TaxID=7936 RepID=A0A0E9RIJ1_ANGAN